MKSNLNLPSCNCINRVIFIMLWGLYRWIVCYVWLNCTSEIKKDYINKAKVKIEDEAIEKKINCN